MSTTDRRRQALAEAARVFESDEAARSWMEQWNAVIGAVPDSLMNEDAGLQTVLRELTAIEYGLPP